MNTTTDIAAASRPSRRHREPLWSARALLWIIPSGLLMAYGLIAFNAGTKVTPLLSDGAVAAEQIDRVIAQADQGVEMVDSPEAQASVPFWINFIARITSSEYAHSSDSVTAAERHYHVMAEPKRHALSLHMMLGLVIMAAGILQFWPAFRRRYRTAHRVLGAAYIGAALVSMSLSSYYLATTPIANVYSQFIFFMGLWLLTAVSVFSIGMAIRAVLRRDIAAHLGWQALAFGCFLTAPIQRALWVGLAPLAGDATFNEMNMAVNVALLPLAFFAGYLLFVANRHAAVPRAAAAPTAAATGWLALGLVGFAATAVVLMLGLFLWTGLGGSGPTLRVATTAAAAAHDAAVLGVRGGVLTVLLTLTLATGVQWLRHAQPQAAPGLLRAFGAAALLSSLALVELAAAIGMPSHAHAHAGTAYGVTGLLMTVLVLWGWRRAAAGELAKVQETAWFLVLLAASPALAYGSLFVFDFTGLIPAPFDTNGHGYQLAATNGLILATIAGHLLAVHSAETRRYAIH